MYDFDITYDWRSKSYAVFVDLGEETITLTRDNLKEMLEALQDAEDSK